MIQLNVIILFSNFLYRANFFLKHTILLKNVVTLFTGQKLWIYFLTRLGARRSNFFSQTYNFNLKKHVTLLKWRKFLVRFFIQSKIIFSGCWRSNSWFFWKNCPASSWYRRVQEARLAFFNSKKVCEAKRVFIVIIVDELYFVF